MLSIFLHIPAMMLAVDHYHSWALFGIWIALIETIRFWIFAIFVLWRRQQDALILLTELSFSPRLFLPSAMLLFVYAAAPLEV